MDSDNQQLEIFDLLNINLPVFEGPLDLLLDLIRKKKMDIRDIPLAEICEPYLEYLELMEEFNMDIAIEFLDIASTLILIKSKTLLPKLEEELEEEEEFDTEEQLRQKLIEYQKFKELAEELNQRELLGRDVFPRPEISEEEEVGELSLEDLSVYGLLKAYHQILLKQSFQKPHEITKDEFSIERKILELLKIFKSGDMQAFISLCPRNPSRSEVVIAFMAILELAKLLLLQIHQMSEFGPLHCKPSPNIGEYIPRYREQIPNAS
ncbi:MAG: segregation/condensation protein A [Proteobacteria bacterium]|nr:segregation/condensation protein A [Pseudomonadota bacterium]